MSVTEGWGGEVGLGGKIISSLAKSPPLNFTLALQAYWCSSLLKEGISCLSLSPNFLCSFTTQIHKSVPRKHMVQNIALKRKEGKC